MIINKDDKTFAKNWEAFGFEPNDLAKLNSKTSGDIGIKCPNCKALGKKHWSTSFPLSVNVAKKVGNCKKCGHIYAIPNQDFWDAQLSHEEKIGEYKLPERENITKISSKGVQAFIDRKISQDAINHFKIAEKNGKIMFPYLRDEELINYKLRAKDAKQGWEQASQALPIMWNEDGIKGAKEIVITEGEFDAMAVWEAGLKHPTSVNAGAPNENDTNVDKKLACITNSFEVLDSAELIYIAVDNDANGKRLEKELIRRFDIEKLRIVDFGMYKDANEVLMFEGKDALSEMIKNGKEPKMEGIITFDDVEDEALDLLRNGGSVGTSTHFPSVDPLWTWRRGEVTMLSGYNNEGKTTFVIQSAMAKAYFDNESFGIFTPENMPIAEFFLYDLAVPFVGKRADSNTLDKFKMKEEEYLNASKFLRKHMFVVNPEKDFTIESLFEKFRYLVKRRGIRHIIIDPYNQIEHRMQKGETLDLYVSRFMTLMKRFAVDNDVSIILVAHQNKPTTLTESGENPPPTRYNIKGGGTFSDKADNVILYVRPYRRTDPKNPVVQLITDKIRKTDLVGSLGDCELEYDWKNKRIVDPLLKINGKPSSPLAMQTASGDPIEAFDPVENKFDYDNNNVEKFELKSGEEIDTEIPF